MISPIKCRLSVCALFLLASLVAKADIFSVSGVDLGAAGRTDEWAIFTTGAVKGKANTNQFTAADVFGNVGIGGNRPLQAIGTIVDGDVYYGSRGRLTVSNGSSVTGDIYHDAVADAVLRQGVIDAMNASRFAASLSVSPQYSRLSNISLKSQNLTLTGSGSTVLRLTNFALNHGTLTLQGTAGTAFIINVRRQFSLTNGSQIVLSGGLQASDVLFNVRGSRGLVRLDQQSNFNGILLATNRTVQIGNGSSVYGSIIAGRVITRGNVTITHPPIVSQ